MNMHRHNWKSLLVVSLLAAAAWSAGTGCSASPMGLVTHLVGEAVNDADVKDKSEKYVGARVAVADEKLGQRVDTYRDVNSAREWIVYPVSLDPLGLSHYVIEALNGRIVAITKTKKYGDPAVGLTEQTIAYEKVKGKTPAGCANALGQAPLLTVRSETSGQLVQIYDASLISIDGVTRPDYYVARFGTDGLCNKLDFVAVSASTKDHPTQG